MTDQATRPFLINKDTEGNFRLTVRDIRYNSQGYPLVSGVLQEECLPDRRRRQDLGARPLQRQGGAISPRSKAL